MPPTFSLATSPFIYGVGGVENSMDATPFFHGGVWHLFHMQTRPRGIAHRVSRDLVNWEIRPMAIPGDAATGGVVEHQGQFYFFYTLNQTVHLATSDNLNDWTPSQRNPVATVDGKHYVGSNFRDPFVFYNEEESCWWMLVAAEVPGPARFRAGCVGLYKSSNLLDWQAAEPLWAPGLGPRHECPQVIRHQGRWYLFDIERQDQYRVAKSLAGPWMRPPSPYLGPHTVLCGTRLGSDGKRWISFPFLCAQRGNEDFGEVVQAEVYPIPRQLDFHADGSVTERPVVELIDALHALPPIRPLAKVAALSGQWDFQSDGTRARSLASSGTLLLKDLPANLYLEAEVTLPKANMEASVLLRVDAGLTRGYKLTLQPADGLVTLRPFSYWDRDRLLVVQHAELPTKRPIRVRIFLSGTVVEAFIDDRVVLSSRLYKHLDGAVALDVMDGAALFDHILARPLAGDHLPADTVR
ncbi:MAG: GH32 C-terminal domain-containing protein [Verrucomicrobiota bacterium]|jgi:beta-fructofuranosidase